MTYDMLRHMVVLHGGDEMVNNNIARYNMYSDTWEWDPVATTAHQYGHWNFRNMTPGLRVDSRMVYFPSTSTRAGKTLLVGGQSPNCAATARQLTDNTDPDNPVHYYATTSAVTFAGDTWEWTGRKWVKRCWPPLGEEWSEPCSSCPSLIGDTTSVTGCPNCAVYSAGAVSAPGLVYDANRDRIILFGGVYESITEFDDGVHVHHGLLVTDAEQNWVQEWDGETWRW